MAGETLECTFKDVEKDSQYYPYIASAQKTEIAAGIGDNLFAGEEFVTKEQVISFAARTLIDKKGYNPSSNPERYGNFTDRENISSWALDNVILAEETGLIQGGGNLNPTSEINRLESSRILYQLFMMLYETSPVENNFYNNVANSNNMPILIICGIAFLIILSIFVLIMSIKRKRNKNKNNISTDNNTQ